MSRHVRANAITEAVTEATQIDQMQESIAQLDQQKKEELIAQIYKYIGRIEASTAFVKFGDVASLIWLKKIKETKAYRVIKGGDTWETFCNYIGLSRRKVDEDLQNLETFGNEFLATVASFDVGYRELRKLRKSITDGKVLIDTNVIEINGERIPFNQDHKEDLEMAIKQVIDDKEETIKKIEKETDRKIKNAETEVKEAEEERDAAINRYQRLKVFEPQGDKGSEWCEEQMREILKAAATFTTLCQKFFIDPKLQDDIPNQARVEGIMTECERMLAGLRRSWTDAFIPEEEM